MERDDTRCYINLRKRRRERSVSSISRLIRNFGLHFSTLVSMSRRLRKTRGNVVRVMQRKWICRANIHFHFRKEIRKSLVSNRTIFSNFEHRESTYIYAYKSRWIIPEPLESDDLGRCGEEFTKFLVARAHSPLLIVLRQSEAIAFRAKITYAGWRSLKRLTCNLTWRLIFWATPNSHCFPNPALPIAFNGLLNERGLDR